MGQILHKRAKTTYATRAEIQKSQESISQLAKKYSINPKTVIKWKHRAQVEDAAMGRKNPRSTVLSILEEQAIVTFRTLTQLPLDDVFIALKDQIPTLTRSNLHRCLRRHGISRLPDLSAIPKARKAFKSYPIGYFHIDVCEVRCDEEKGYLFVGIDRTSKLAYVELCTSKTALVAAGFLEKLIEFVPYKIHTILTDNGVEFTDTIQTKYRLKTHRFDSVCQRHGIDHRLTKVKHPWTNGQVERMNRTIKEATVKTYHYASFQQLFAHLKDFVNAYNFAKSLKSLKWKTPFEFVHDCWTKNPTSFIIKPDPYNMGLNT